jgi:alpha-tubulin suppressor-like RCC1 family protein
MASGILRAVNSLHHTLLTCWIGAALLLGGCLKVPERPLVEPDIEAAPLPGPDGVLCQPCYSRLDCGATEGILCARISPEEGSFCTIACVSSDECPSDYECRNKTTAASPDEPLGVCIPITEHCTCSAEAIDKAAQTACYDNADKDCVGIRSCTPEGLGACSASENGDVCEGDLDGDGHGDNTDNCPENYNPDQVDTDQTNGGDVCDQPLPPTMSLLTTSPGNQPNVEILALSIGQAIVELFLGEDCSGDALQSLENTDNGEVTFQLTVDEETTTWSSRVTNSAGLTSLCSNPVTYAYDTLPPNVPTIAASDVTSPSNKPLNENGKVMVNVTGTLDGGEEGLQISIRSQTCDGEGIGNGAGNDFNVNGGGIAVALQPNEANLLFAKAIDAAGNESACQVDPFVFVHDNVAPAPPVIDTTSTTSPTNASAVEVSLSVEEGATALVFNGAECTEENELVQANVAENLTTVKVRLDLLFGTQNEFSFKAIDQATNVSACTDTLTFVQDSVPPPSVVDLAISTLDDGTQSLSGVAVEASTVTVFSNESCSKEVDTASVLDNGFAFPLGTLALNQEHSFWVRSYDLANNPSDCVGPTSYTKDTMPPVFSGVLSVRATSDQSIKVTWEAAVDNLKPNDPITYKVCHSKTPGVCSGGGAGVGVVDSLETDMEGLDMATRYYVHVVAQDASGNVSENTIERSAETFGEHGLIGISQGRTHRCMLMSHGEVYCSGSNTYGQVGSAFLGEFEEPEKVTIQGVVEVAAGGYHTCALLGNGSVWCWGRNQHLQVGVDGSDALSTPTQVMGLPAATSLSIGENHSCALSASAEVWCWGLNSFGLLAQPTDLSKTSTPLKADAFGNVRDLAAGKLHTCVVDVTGDVLCVGNGAEYQLGSDEAGFSDVPQTVESLPLNALSVATADGLTCAILTDRSLWCWGEEAYALSDIKNPPEPWLPLKIADNSLQVVLGDGYGCRLTTLGEVICWGEEAPNGVSDDFPIEPHGPWRALTARGSVACAQTANGQAHCVDSPPSGDISSPLTPTAPRLPVGLAASESATVLLRSDGSITMLGSLNDPLSNDALNVTLSAAALPSAPIAVDVSSHHLCAILANGDVACWGDNTYGQLGNGTTEDSQDAVLHAGLQATHVTVGERHSCAALTTGELACWGDNASGQFVHSNVAASLIPLFDNLPDWPPGKTSWAEQVEAGKDYSCVITTNGAMLCDGLNDFDQCGNLPDKGIVTMEAGSVRTVSLYRDFTCAGTTTGAVMCWGRNDTGQLGGADDGSPISIPTLVPDVGQAKDVRVGQTHACTLQSNGKVTCWGDSQEGQTGTGLGGVTAPTALLLPQEAKAIKALAVGGQHTCVLDASGQVLCWGSNQKGQTGQNIGEGTDLLPSFVPNL